MATRNLIYSLLLAASMAVVTSTSSPAETSAAPAAKPDLPNFHQVEPYLYRGGEPTEKGLKDLKEMGIKTIIDLRNPGEMKYSEQAEAGRLGMRYISMPMDSRAPTKKMVDKFIRTVETAKEKSPDKPSVFLHCAHGSDRTGCLIGVWRVTHNGYDYSKAYEEMRKYYFTPKFTNLSGTVKTYAEHTGTGTTTTTSTTQ